MFLGTTIEQSTACEPAFVIYSEAEALVDVMACCRLDFLPNRQFWPRVVLVSDCMCEDLANVLITDVQPVDLGQALACFPDPRRERCLIHMTGTIDGARYNFPLAQESIGVGGNYGRNFGFLVIELRLWCERLSAA